MVAPVVCFALLPTAVGDVFMWPCAAFVIVSLIAFGVSIVRTPRDDGVDAFLHGALFTATLFAIPWGVAFASIVTGLKPRFLALDLPFQVLLLSTAPPIALFIYLRRLLRRWPTGGVPRTSTSALIAGGIAPALLCIASGFVLAVCAERTERSVIDDPHSVNLGALELWRVIAPNRDWSAIQTARFEERDQERRRALHAAHRALTGKWRELVIATDVRRRRRRAPAGLRNARRAGLAITSRSSRR